MLEQWRLWISKLLCPGGILSSHRKRNQHHVNANNEDSISSELSLDFLAKERAREIGDSNTQETSSSSSSSCRWNPDDSDYSLNVLLVPRNISPQNTDDKKKGASCEEDDSVSATCKESVLGTDYSLNKLRARARNSKVIEASSCHSTLTDNTFDTEFSAKSDYSLNNIRAGARIKMMDLSCHSSLSIDTFDTDFSVRNKLPQDIEVKKPEVAKTRTPRVSFYPRVRIQRVQQRKLIPQDQKELVWYSRDEFNVIRQECFNTITLMKDDEEDTDDTDTLFDEDGNELCRRGLEYKTPEAYKRRQKQKKDIRNIVFEEVDFQEEQGMNDPEWLAKLSRDQSRSCVEAAIQVARVDEKVARAYLGCEIELNSD